MTRSGICCFFLSIAFFLFGVVACSKDKTTNTTTINGTIVDKVTGAPLDNAVITFLVEHNDILPPNNYEFPSILSDNLGQFNFSSNEYLQIYTMQKGGYLQKGPEASLSGAGIEQGKINDIKFEMIPLDGILKLILKNNGQANKFYIGGYSPIKDAEWSATNGLIFRDTFYIETAMEANRVLKLASEETISIFWGLPPLPYNLSSLTPQGTVFVTRADTTTYNITF